VVEIDVLINYNFVDFSRSYFLNMACLLKISHESSQSKANDAIIVVASLSEIEELNSCPLKIQGRNNWKWSSINSIYLGKLSD
jgi:hypothetical protein